MFRETHVQHAEALRRQHAASTPCADTMEQSSCPSRMSESASARLSAEDMVEEIDASESTDLPQQSEPSVQAVLLEDGRCAVCIVRQNGTRQTVVIDPPEMHHTTSRW